MASASFADLSKDLELDGLMKFARICENAERFEDMSAIMKQIVVKMKSAGTPLQEEHETLMSVAFKNVVGELRKAHRKLELEEVDFPDLHEAYKKRITQEVVAQCQEVINLLNENLVDTEFVAKHKETWKTFLAENSDKDDIKQAEESQREKLLQMKFKGNFDAVAIRKLESQTYYLKMLGDYWRYLSEASPSEESKKQAESNYEDAWETAKSFMPPTHPTRLGLALNSSVFVQEIQKNTQRAQAIAKEAFESAIQSLDTLNDTSYKDSTLIMQLLRDNLTIWQQQAEAKGDDNAIED